MWPKIASGKLIRKAWCAEVEAGFSIKKELGVLRVELETDCVWGRVSLQVDLMRVTRHPVYGVTRQSH